MHNPTLLTSPGVLVALAGTDASGKSTLSRRIKARCPSWVRTAEPYGDLPLSSPESAYLADRRAHVDDVILPNLDANRVVVTDRYFACTAAYQGRSRREALRIFRRHAALFPAPDLWVLVDTPDHEVARRLRRRGEGDQIRRALAAAEQYRWLFSSDGPARAVVLDGRANPRALADYVRDLVVRLTAKKAHYLPQG